VCSTCDGGHKADKAGCRCSCSIRTRVAGARGSGLTRKQEPRVFPFSRPRQKRAALVCTYRPIVNRGRGMTCSHAMTRCRTKIIHWTFRLLAGMLRISQLDAARRCSGLVGRERRAQRPAPCSASGTLRGWTEPVLTPQDVALLFRCRRDTRPGHQARERSRSLRPAAFACRGLVASKLKEQL
jgi:hypothetical protein